jgi:hypothetical protein
MKQETLDRLYTLATREDTPEEERRTSAVVYLKHAPRWRSPTREELAAVITRDIVLKHVGLELEEKDRKLREVREAVDIVKTRAEKAETDLRELKEALLARRVADERIEKILGTGSVPGKVNVTNPDKSLFGVHPSWFNGPGWNPK